MPSSRASAQASARYPSAARLSSVWSDGGATAGRGRVRMLIIFPSADAPAPLIGTPLACAPAAPSRHLSERLIQPVHSLTDASIRVAGRDVARDLGALFQIAANDDIGGRRAGPVGLLEAA